MSTVVEEANSGREMNAITRSVATLVLDDSIHTYSDYFLCTRLVNSPSEIKTQPQGYEKTTGVNEIMKVWVEYNGGR